MHFVKHSLTLAMLVVLTGCGGSNSTAPSSGGGSETPAENTMVVSSVSPQSAIVGVLTTFTLSGTNMSSKMQVSLPNCQNISALSGSTSRVTFTCTPQAEGTQVLTVRTAEGMSFFNSDIKFQTTANTDDVSVSELEIPSVVTVGQIATFVVKGQNLSNTLPISLPQCTNITRTSISPTQIVFTCTPQAAGTQTLKVSSETGVELRSGNVIMQSPPPALTGSWRSSIANGCTDLNSIGGEAIADAKSKQPLFTFIRDSETQIRLMGNEGIGYLSTDCSETTAVTTPPTTGTTTTGTTTTPAPQFAVTTGVAKFAAVYTDLGAVQQTSGLNYYYPVNTSYSRTGFSSPSATAIVFKDTDNFCLFDGTVTAANIGTFIEGITPNTAGCFVRSGAVPFSQKPPASPLTKYQYQLAERQANDSSLTVVERLNQRGQKGEVLLHEAVSLQPSINSSNRNSYDVFGSFSDYKFDYRTKDEPAQGANFDSNRLADLNELGKEGYLLVGKRQLNAFLEPKSLYTKVSVGIRPKLTFDYQLSNDNDVNDATKLISILDAQGAQGCRFVDLRLQTTATNTYATVCVNSSKHSGVFKYRYVPYPTSTRADALAALLDTQKSGGFYPIRVLKLGTNEAPHILFENDSRIESSIGRMQYKVYSQALPSNQPEQISLLNDQGKLGWHLWSQINDPSGNHLATIFASQTFSHLEDGEAVVLDPR